MGKFPFSFRTKVTDNPRLDLALATNFDKAATEEYVQSVAADVTAGVVTDHGVLTGLSDDDHTQYHTDARGDARYVKLDLTNTPAGLATQTELDSEAATRAAADTALDGRLDTIESDYLTSVEGDAAYQPKDADLTAIAGLAPTNDDVVQRKAGAWTNRTMAQLASDLDAAGLATDSALTTGLAGKANTSHTHAQADVTNLVSDLAAKQPLDADLTTIAALDSGTSAGVMATEAAGWVKRTYAQVKTSLALVKADVGLGNVDNTSDANKPVSTAQQTALDLKANLASPALTGTPTAPTAAADTDTTQVATTAFVQQEISDHLADVYQGLWQDDVQYAVGDVVVFDGHSLLCTSTPTLGVEPYGNDAGVWDYDVWDGTTWGGANGWTYLAARGATGAGATAALTTFTPAGGLAANDVQEALEELDTEKAPKASPTFTGTPAAPTAAQGTNTTQVATTAYVQTEAGLLIPKSIGDAKGDLIGFSAADTPVRIPAASVNGSVITSDTSQTGGVKWTPIPAQPISERAGRASAGMGTTGHVIGSGFVPVLFNAAGATGSLIRITPDDWGPSGVTLRLRVWCQTETDPTDSTLTASLRRLTGVGGSGTLGSSTLIVSASGMSVTAANTTYEADAADTAVTTAGYYFVIFGHSVNPAQAMTYGYTLLGRPVL